MTSDTILSVICQWLNSLGYKAIKAPSDNPAPAGRYVAVGSGSTRQHGDAIIPGPVSEDSTGIKYRTFLFVTTVQLYEVEGDGDWLRDIRCRIEDGEMDDFVKAKLPMDENGRDQGFRVWDMGEIVDNSSQDGGYWIRQRTMTIDVQFSDYYEHTAERNPRMATVGLTLEPSGN